MTSNAALKTALGAGVILALGLASASASDQAGQRDPLFLSGPLKALRVASLDLPQPLGTGLIAPDIAEPAASPEADAARPGDQKTAPDLAAAPPTEGAVAEDEGLQMMPGALFGPSPAAPLTQAGPLGALTTQASLTRLSPEGPAIYHDPVAVFGTDPTLFPPLAFEYLALADRGLVPQPLPRPAVSFALQANNVGTADETPAEFLGLTGPRLAKAERCMTEAIYFESRGEPKRGQIAVAQVILNRVLSGYYPKDVCGTVYQNAHRRLACQFTFACDNVKDVVREPDMWAQAQQISSDMLAGRLWLDSVGRATHYHAYWVHPSWTREMRKLDRIGVHTFYRPRRWEG